MSCERQSPDPCHEVMQLYRKAETERNRLKARVSECGEVSAHGNELLRFCMLNLRDRWLKG